MTIPKPLNVIGIGELLWDLLPSGPVLGGAPANFACIASQLGASAGLISCVGRDDLGARAIESLGYRQVSAEEVSRSRHPTGTVEITLDSAGKPSYEVLQNVAWDHISWSDSLPLVVSSVNAVCFGTLAQRSEKSQQTIHQFLRATACKALRVFDVNLRAPFFNDESILRSLEAANVLKLNDEELPSVAKVCGLSGTETSLLRQLASQYDLKAVALTCGERGAKLLLDEDLYEHAAFPAEVVDTVGAGDAYSAALTIGLLEGHEGDAINRAACKIAAFVCSQTGPSPTMPKGLVSNAFSWNESLDP